MNYAKYYKNEINSEDTSDVAVGIMLDDSDENVLNNTFYIYNNQLLVLMNNSCGNTINLSGLFEGSILVDGVSFKVDELDGFICDLTKKCNNHWVGICDTMD